MAIPLGGSEAIAWGIDAVWHFLWLWQSMLHFPAYRQPLGWQVNASDSGIFWNRVVLTFAYYHLIYRHLNIWQLIC